MRMMLESIVLACVYCLALASVHPWDFGIGALLGFGILRAFRSFLFIEPETSIGNVLARALHFPLLVLAIGFDIVKGTVDVARLVLSARIGTEGEMVGIPGGGRSASGVIVSGLINTISPGSVLIDIDPQTYEWTIHTVDTSPPEEVIARQQAIYTRFQRPVWP